MKKIFYLFLIVFTVFSCTNKSGYTIKGTSDLGWLNGRTIYLSDLSGVQFFDTDSTIVKNGKFTFKGVADTAKVSGIWFFDEQNSQKIRRILILENGNINVRIVSENEILVSGTKLNDIYTHYENSITELYKKYDKASQISEMETQKIQDEITQFEFNFCLENATNLVGKAIFLQSFYNFSVEQKEQITNLFDEETKKDEKIALVIENLERERRVAVGQQFTDFAQPTPQGDILKLSDWVGKTDYLLVDFWASWCGPCIRSFPALKSVYEKYQGRGEGPSNWFFIS
jgi:thiol-disulfide isomerase/thioredoxin